MMHWHKHRVRLVVIYICLFYCSVSMSAKQETFEAILKEARDCADPNPPYPKKCPIICSYSITVVNGKRYFNGNSTVTADTPFQNFSGRTYDVDDVGRRTLKFQIPHVTCRNIFVRAFLTYAHLTLDSKNCMLRKGKYQHEQMDLDKISHTMLSWHARGNIVHELQLVAGGSTVFCAEFHVTVQ
ncbi:uncharacterized protein LOC134800646 [Cydia splendana]|uniref:uncharacterized protein LOC134800646 n=1 Tax=Cydia splendana TaxID=1100963 RepID=UPI0028F46A4C